jgi:hypothetical protein
MQANYIASAVGGENSTPEEQSEMQFLSGKNGAKKKKSPVNKDKKQFYLTT